MRFGLVRDVLRDEVVAGLVDDRVEVREHAEVGRVLDLREDAPLACRPSAGGLSTSNVATS